MNGKRILISGASRGLGLCLTKKLLAEGNEVHAIVRTKTEEVTRLSEMYGTYHFYMGDVSRNERLKPALEEINNKVNRFDYIFNVAAIFWEKDRKGLMDLNIDEMGEMVQINAFGALRILKGLSEKIDGETKIINVSSESGCLTNCEDVGLYSYDISKAALNMATKIYDNEHGKKRNIIAVDPGWMRTDMGGASADLDPDFSAQKLIELAENIDSLEEGKLFFKYDGRALPW